MVGVKKGGLMRTIIFMIALLLFCGVFNVHPNLIAVSLAVLWHAYIDEKR